MTEQFNRIVGKGLEIAGLEAKKATLESVRDAALAAAGGTLPSLPGLPSGLAELGKDFIPMYGRVNFWATSRAELEKDVQMCAKYRVSYTIEFAAWPPAPIIFSSQAQLEHQINEFKWLLGELRKNDLWLFTSIANWNMTMSKYGNSARSFNSMTPMLQAATLAIKAEGPENQIIQPSAETGNDNSAKNYEKWAGAQLAGWNLCYNGGSRPKKPAYGWPHFAYHPVSIGVTPPAGSLAVSDTGAIIRQLAADGSLNGPGDPGKVQAWVQLCKNAGAHLGAYYAFQRQSHDAAAIQACGKVQ